MEETHDPLHVTPGPIGSMSNKKNTGKILRILLALAVLLVVVACAFWFLVVQGKNVVSNEQDVTGPVVTITATGFVPSTIRVDKGKEVMWVNIDTRPHRIVSVSDLVKGFDSNEKLVQNGTYEYQMNKAGTFQYYDSSDAKTYTGTIIVQEP